MKIEIGIENEARVRIAEGLSKILADSYTLYLKTHSFHWNVTGPMFQTLHLMFEQHYTELALAVDLIAERIRSLGEVAPGSYSQFSALATVKEETGVPTADEMIRQLIKDHETVARNCRATLPLCQDVSDEASTDLLVGRMSVHEKTAWMLRALVA